MKTVKTLPGFTQKQMRRGPAILVVCFLLTYLAASAFAQNAKINLSHLDKLASKASKVANVDLEGPMLKLAAQNMAEKNPTPKEKAEQEMLQRLKGIYVRSYKFSKAGEYRRADLENVLKQLQSGGWTSIVNVEKKQEGAMTAVYVMNEGGETIGMTVVAAKPEKLTVVNLVGPIDLAELGGLDGLGGILNASTAGIQHRSPPQKTAANQAH